MLHLLPAELGFVVIWFLQNPELKAMRLVCRSLSEIATGRLFSEVVLQFTWNPQNVEKIMNSHLAKHVKKLRVIRGSHEEEPNLGGARNILFSNVLHPGPLNSTSQARTVLHRRKAITSIEIGDTALQSLVAYFTWSDAENQVMPPDLYLPLEAFWAGVLSDHLPGSLDQVTEVTLRLMTPETPALRPCMLCSHNFKDTDGCKPRQFYGRLRKLTVERHGRGYWGYIDSFSAAGFFHTLQCVQFAAHAVSIEIADYTQTTGDFNKSYTPLPPGLLRHVFLRRLALRQLVVSFEDFKDIVASASDNLEVLVLDSVILTHRDDFYSGGGAFSLEPAAFEDEFTILKDPEHVLANASFLTDILRECKKLKEVHAAIAYKDKDYIIQKISMRL